MSIFGNILGKIFHHDKAQAQQPSGAHDAGA